MKRADTTNTQMPQGLPQGSSDVITRPGAPEAEAKLAKQPSKKATEKKAKHMASEDKLSNEGAKKDEKPKRRKRGTAARGRINLGAGLLTFMWMGLLVAFSYGFYVEGARNLTLSPATWAGLIAALLVPVAFIWFGAIVLKRLLDLNDTSLRLATISRELTDPGTTAANDVAKLGATIRKELNSLNRELDTAVSRVSELESRLKQHTTMIDETAKRVDKRTGDIASRLTEEREKVDAVTRSLSAEAKLIGETLDMQAFAINKASTEATSALAQANEDLSTRTIGLDKAAGEAAATTKTIAEDIERETGKLENVSASARSRAEAISTRYAEQHKAMAETLAQHGEQQTKLQAAMEQQQQLVNGMAETVARQVKRIEESVAQATGEFSNAIDEARDKAADAGMSFEDRAKAISEAADAAADRLGAAADAVSLLSGEAQEDLENQMRTTDKALHRQTADALAMLEEQTQRATTLLDQHADASRTHMGSQGEVARTELDEQARTARADLAEQTKAALDLLAEQSDAVLAKLDDQSNTAKSHLESQADVAQVKMAEQDATARALLEGQSKAASSTLNTQADELSAAVERSLDHLRGRLSELTDKGSAAMIGRAEELDEALRAGEESMRQLSERLNVSIEGVQTGSEDVGRRFSETADAFEARMAQFPAHADDAVAKVRSQISAQIEALAKLADAAAGKAHELTHAIANQNAGQNANGANASIEDEDQVELFEERIAPQTASQPVSPPKELSTERPKAGFNLKLRDPQPAPKTYEDETESETERRSRLGATLANSIKGRLRNSGAPTEPREETPAGIQAASSTGAIRAEEMEDISDFRVTKKAETKPASQERGELLSPGDRPAPRFEDRGWSQILKSADEREVVQPDPRTDTQSTQRDDLLIIEKLQALSIDLDRALEDEPSAELLDRYMNGERNVFARRLATFTGPEMLERIARSHREDAEFRTVVNRYIEGFESLLRGARGQDRENILVETYLTSQTGKVYMILGTATGHLK